MDRAKHNAELERLRNQYIAKGNVSSTDRYIVKGEGAVLTDVEGNQYIDFGGGIAVMNVGHSHPKVVKAIKEQADRFTHTCFMVSPYAAPVRLAEKLCRAVPGDSPKAAMFANCGVEAVENAVKIARYYTKKKGIIVFDGCFHGRTLMGMSLTSKVKPYKLGMGPFAPEIYRMPYPNCYRCPFGRTYPHCSCSCADYLEEFFITHVAPEETAAVLIEPVQGEGGFIAPPKEYLGKLKAICEKNGILVICDEVQSGMGRTGHMFASEYFGIEADLITVAKSLAAGMPLSAVVGKKEIMDSVHASGIGGTYNGNPLACEAALAVFDIFENEGLLDQAKKLGATLLTRLKTMEQKFPLIGDVRGLGPMAAIELVEDRNTKEPAAGKAKELVRFCMERNLIILSCSPLGNVIRFLMPLNIEDHLLEQGLNILEEGLASLS
jgi:4-aminobutyrate aminotransferase / (S)-3-amino-2-methylpropionate transaminase / 5-aminovalerate transaminase